MGKKIYLEVDLGEIDDESLANVMRHPARGIFGCSAPIDDSVRDITPAIDAVIRSRQGFVASRSSLKEVGEYISRLSGSEGMVATTAMCMTINTICGMLGYSVNPIEEAPAT